MTDSAADNRAALERALDHFSRGFGDLEAAGGCFEICDPDCGPPICHHHSE